MFQIDLIPAAQGDCVWIRYGARGAAAHHVLIDGGTAPTYDHLRARIRQLPDGKRRFDLLIVTHVDADHIEGIIRLLQDDSLGLQFDDVWFNGWKHLPTDRLGPAQGEMLSALLGRRGRPGRPSLPWNRAFQDRAVQVDPDPTVALPRVQLDGGMQLTVLSPRREDLSKLVPYWEDEVRKAHLDAGNRQQALELLGRSRRLRADALGPAFDVQEAAARRFVPDTGEANGASIVVLAEYDGARCLLAADAHARVLLDTIPRLLAERPGLHLDAFKLPHHGSRKNVSLALAQAWPARHYLFSTNGALHQHPHPEAVSRVLVGTDDEKDLWFNYSTVFNEMWSDDGLLSDFKATANFPPTQGPGMGISLSL
jgi:beta-lactamase superfamily II metal-dependent hydrolase